MSDIAKLHVTLIGVVFVFAASVFMYWPSSAGTTASAMASPYCAANSFDAPIVAKAVYVKDITSGEMMYSKNENTQLVLASLTKLMTVLTASDTLSRDDTITISREALTPEGGMLREGEVWKAGELIDYVLITSDNDAAHALALAATEKAQETEGAFVDRMNAKAKAIGLAQTYFTNDTGLDYAESVGSTYGSAHDVALLLEYAFRHSPRLVEGSAAQEREFITLSGEKHTAKNTTPISAELGNVIASKTGFTDLAGRNLAVIFEPVLGHPTVAVILGSTTEARDSDMLAIAAASKKWLSRAILCGAYGY